MDNAPFGGGPAYDSGMNKAVGISVSTPSHLQETKAELNKVVDEWKLAIEGAHLLI